MHNKFVIIDSRLVITGSMNFTRAAASSNWENLVILTDKKTVLRFKKYFDKMWATIQTNAHREPLHAR